MNRSDFFRYGYDNREDRIRTCDPLVPNQVLYQAELLPDVSEAIMLSLLK